MRHGAQGLVLLSQYGFYSQENRQLIKHDKPHLDQIYLTHLDLWSHRQAAKV